VTSVGAKPAKRVMATVQTEWRQIASAPTRSSLQRDHGNDGVIVHPQHVLHVRTSPNTHSTSEELNLTACSVNHRDGGLRGKAATVPVHEPAHVVSDAMQVGYQFTHIDMSTGADEDEEEDEEKGPGRLLWALLVGAGRVQNAESAASTMVWKMGQSNRINHAALQSRATCPEHWTAVKLHAWVFKVVALASHEDEDERCDK
jgi:hypothetical protein